MSKRVEYQEDGAPGPYRPPTLSPWTAPPCHRDAQIEDVLAAALRANGKVAAAFEALDQEVRRLRGQVHDLGGEWSGIPKPAPPALDPNRYVSWLESDEL